MNIISTTFYTIATFNAIILAIFSIGSIFSIRFELTIFSLVFIIPIILCLILAGVSFIAELFWWHFKVGFPRNRFLKFFNILGTVCLFYILIAPIVNEVVREMLGE